MLAQTGDESYVFITSCCSFALAHRPYAIVESVKYLVHVPRYPCSHMKDRRTCVLWSQGCGTDTLDTGLSNSPTTLIFSYRQPNGTAKTYPTQPHMSRSLRADGWPDIQRSRERLMPTKSSKSQGCLFKTFVFRHQIYSDVAINNSTLAVCHLRFYRQQQRHNSRLRFLP